MKNKAIAILLILILTLLLPAGCSGNQPPQGNGNVGQDPVVQPEDNPLASDETEDISNDPSSEIKLAVAYTDILNSGVYYMKYRNLMETADQINESTMEVAVNGNDRALIAMIGGNENIIIVKDEKVHVVDHNNKKIFVLPADVSTNKPVLPSSEYNYKSSGSVELFGVLRSYEDYTTEAGDIRFFFDGDKLLGFESSFGDIRVKMEVLELSTIVPPGIFDLPEGYDIVEY
jgi:hypothetical protein